MDCSWTQVAAYAIGVAGLVALAIGVMGLIGFVFWAVLR